MFFDDFKSPPEEGIKFIHYLLAQSFEFSKLPTSIGLLKKI